METVVIDWSNQIYKVLKKDSSEPLLEGKNPTPHVEISFWKNRLMSHLKNFSRSDVMLLRKAEFLTLLLRFYVLL